MNNKLIPVIAGLAVVGLAAYVVHAKPQAPAPVPAVSQPRTPSAVQDVPSAPQDAPSADKTYTMADVAQHKDRSSCWTTINGGVYDVTSWISMHPGGEQAILGLCGNDGSDAFNGQHGGQRRPEAELATFKIGTLVK